MQKPKLISFKICPFVQRSVILLKEKSIDYNIAFIDIDDPPAWFLELSPTGKVPVMQIDDTILFESAVINEYIDEVFPPSLHPINSLEKAQNRAWIEYTSSLYMTMFNLMMAKTKEGFEKILKEFDKPLADLEKVKAEGPWFNGKEYSMMDIAIAPFFTRIEFIKNHCSIDFIKSFNHLYGWSEDLLARQSVIDSIPEGFDEIHLMYMKEARSYLVG